MLVTKLPRGKRICISKMSLRDPALRNVFDRAPSSPQAMGGSGGWALNKSQICLLHRTICSVAFETPVYLVGSLLCVRI